MNSGRKSLIVVFSAVLPAAIIILLICVWAPWLPRNAEFPEPVSKELLWGIDEGGLIPGTSVFRNFFDKGHGVAFISGTFDLPVGDKVTVRSWSPQVIARSKYFDIFLSPHDVGEKSGPGPTGSYEVKIKAGDFWADFVATGDVSNLWINNFSREQLRQMVKAHEAVFDLGNGKTITLHEEQLVQIRTLLAYTDKLPESTF